MRAYTGDYTEASETAIRPVNRNLAMLQTRWTVQSSSLEHLLFFTKNTSLSYRITSAMQRRTIEQNLPLP